MMTTKRGPLQDDTPIIERLRNLPDLSPPDSLRRSIMASVRPKTPSLWRRIHRFWFQPHTLTFVPIRWAPVAACLLLLTVVPRLAPVDRATKVAEHGTSGQARLTFTFEHPDAQKVALIGTFNRWAQDGRVETERHGNIWVFHIDVAPGRYEYAFLVDGEEVVPDPRAAFRSHNGFGVPNSIIYATTNGQNHI